MDNSRDLKAEAAGGLDSVATILRLAELAKSAESCRGEIELAGGWRAVTFST